MGKESKFAIGEKPNELRARALFKGNKMGWEWL
jgi:hypothetical protein